MENFKQLFHDEASGFLINLEDTLLNLENDLNNKELINEVFRIMHSLKGSGAMFGYKNLSGLTHDLETLFDQIRNNEIPLTIEITSFTMRIIDVINQLLENDNDSDALSSIDSIKSQINSFISNSTIVENTTESEILPEISQNEPIEKVKTYFIRFIPNEDILNDGTNPIYLIDELVDLGQHIIRLNTNQLPSIESLNPEKIKLSWTIILSSSSTLEEILEVFIFVEDDSEIIIKEISSIDLLNNPIVLAELYSALENDIVDIESYISIANEGHSGQGPLDNEAVRKHETGEDKTSLPDADEKRSSAISMPSPVKINTVNVASSKLDTLINLVSELVTSQARLSTISSEKNYSEIEQLSEDMQLLTRQFRDISFEMRLIPVHTLVVKFKRLVRDLSKELGKKVNFITEGTETEMDKSIISAISDPIMHIIRNAIDHGIESPDIRVENQKDETGTIIFKVYSEGNSIIIKVSDDGAGINKQKVLKKALEKELITTIDEINDNEVVSLLMKPGFSTSDEITDVSGRGVGMDVVRKKIDELRGEVSIQTIEGSGTDIVIKLPLTLSIIDGLLIIVNNESFIIPLSDVIQIYQVDNNKVENTRNNIIDIDGTQYPFLYLSKLFSPDSYDSENLNFITVSYKEQSVGLVVNQLISEYQAVLKPINMVMKNNEIFAGATILGDGRVAMVLDIVSLIEHYSNNKTG